MFGITISMSTDGIKEIVVWVFEMVKNFFRLIVKSS